MAKFRKSIVTAGVYEIPSSDGKNRIELLTADRLKHWAETAKRMEQSGFRIPAPWNHDGAALPIQTGQDGTLRTSFENGGFWSDLQVKSNADGVATLYGTLDVPGDPQDHSSPAAKIGTTVRDTSIYVRPQFSDSKGQKWEDALMHIALVTHPVEQGQDNFEPSFSQKNEAGVAISMSHRLVLSRPENQPPQKDVFMAIRDFQPSGASATIPGAPDQIEGSGPNEQQEINSFKELLLRLREIAKIALPEDTTVQNLVERLRVVLLQKEASEEADEEEEGSTTQPPEGAKEQPAPVVMSFNAQQIDAIIAAKVVNPSTGKPFSKDELAKVGEPKPVETNPDVVMSHPKVVELTNACNFFAKRLNDMTLGEIRSRVQGLVAKGKISKDYVEKKLAPLMEGFQMSYSPDGTRQPHQIEVVLDALEAANSLVGPAVSQGVMNQQQAAAYLAMNFSKEEPMPPDFLNGGVLNEEDASKVANEFLKNTGR
jgi:hypothetical protein